MAPLPRASAIQEQAHVFQLRRQLGAKAWLLAAALVLAVSAGASAPVAANQCTAGCQAAYAQCYKSSGSNRKACEAQLQQCLSACIRR